MTFPLTLGTPGGGTEDCLQLARHMSRAGAEIVLLTASNIGPSRFPRPRIPDHMSGREQAAALREDSVDVIRVPHHPAYFLLDGLPMKKAVKALLAQRRIDALLGWAHEAAFLPHLLRSRRVVFAVNAAASYAPIFRPQGRPRLRQFLQARIILPRTLKTADVVFARSQFTRQEIVGFAGVEDDKVRVVYCGVDPLFAKARRSFAPEVSHLLFYGRFVPGKGLFDALDALGRVAARGHRKWTLRIAGWGDEEGVRAAARRGGILDRIELLGALDHPALVRALEWSHVVIMPSYTESFGLANAEAQAAGVPVIAYKVAAVPEVVEHGVTGWLVPVARVDLLAETIAHALQDPHETYRAGLAGRERMARLFSWERTSEETLRGLEQTIARNTY